jgi:hypothetical protein
MFSDRKRGEGKNVITEAKEERNEGWLVEKNKWMNGGNTEPTS